MQIYDNLAQKAITLLVLIFVGINFLGISRFLTKFAKICAREKCYFGKFYHC